MMQYYVCSLANEGKGNLVPLLTDNVALIEKFVADHDRPGRAVYSCVNPLKDGAARRCKDSVAAIVTLHVDVDNKRLEEPPETIRQALLEMARSLPFEIRDSGGGFHIYANLKEAYENGTGHYRRAEHLRTRLTEVLCGDPAPNHSAALMRVVGTHNTKYGEPREVTVIKGGEPVDLTDVEAFLDYYPARLFKVREECQPKSADVVDLFTSWQPIDTDAVLVDMPASGEGVNAVQWRLMRALIVREGRTPNEALDIVVNATMAMAEREGLSYEDGKLWTREDEIRAAVPRMNWVLGRLQKEHWEAVDAGRLAADAVPDWLWPEVHEQWTVACHIGLRPQISRNSGGWFVRRPWGAAKEDSADRLKGTDLGGTKTITAHQNKLLAGLMPFVAFDPLTLPAREWMYGRHYQRGMVSLTVGTGGRGKTSLVLVEVIAMVLCMKLLGEQPSTRSRVWYHCGEDDMDELRRRIAATCQRYGVNMNDLEGWLYLTTANEFPLKVAEGYNEVKVDTKLISRITELIEENEIDLAVFDPLVTLHATSENDAGKMSQVIGAFKKIAIQTRCGVELVHHTRKAMPGSDHDATDMRGSSVIHDAARAVRVLNVMNENEAQALSIPIHERTLYVRVDRGKGNFAPPGKAKWVHLVNVDLPNGDEVGVVEFLGASGTRRRPFRGNARG